MNQQDKNLTEIWKGSFGDDYISRNRIGKKNLRDRTNFWAEILCSIPEANLKSILEVGANIGGNLMAMSQLTDATLYAVEPNSAAREELIKSGLMPEDRIHDGCASSIPLSDSCTDLVFTRGVLIHIEPEELLKSCSEIYRVSNRYIACVEYFSDQPETIVYRGEEGLLFKRDFSAFWLENFPDLKPVSFGFSWKPLSGLDNMNWWVFEKK